MNSDRLPKLHSTYRRLGKLAKERDPKNETVVYIIVEVTSGPGVKQTSGTITSAHYFRCYGGSFIYERHESVRARIEAIVPALIWNTASYYEQCIFTPLMSIKKWGSGVYCMKESPVDRVVP